MMGMRRKRGMGDMSAFRDFLGIGEERHEEF
jgi:hypothetical protein